jgi:hypothetical protein
VQAVYALTVPDMGYDSMGVVPRSKRPAVKYISP